MAAVDVDANRRRRDVGDERKRFGLDDDDDNDGKDALIMDNRNDPIETIKDDARDAVDEAKERVKAGGEKVNRAAQGDTMPLGERVASHVKEIGHNVRADVDKSKRDVRDNT